MNFKNFERAGRGERTLNQDFYCNDPESALVDVLADLMHFCNQNSEFDFDTELLIARQHFEEEEEEEDKADGN